MLKRPQYIALSIVAVAALVLLNLPSQTTGRLKLALGGLFLPLFGLAGSAQKLGEAAGIRAMPKGALIDEVQKLRRENQELRLELLQAAELSRENEMLRAAVQWQPRVPWRIRLAPGCHPRPGQLVAHHSDRPRKPGRGGENLPVITEEGLVGRVEEVGLNFSRVVLIGDPNCRVSVVVENETRDTGIVLPGPDSVLDESIVQVTYLSRHSKVQPGQRASTSGLGSIFPKGIPVGTIIDGSKTSDGLYREARIKLAVDFRELEEVWVVFP